MGQFDLQKIVLICKSYQDGRWSWREENTFWKTDWKVWPNSDRRTSSGRGWVEKTMGDKNSSQYFTIGKPRARKHQAFKQGLFGGEKKRLKKKRGLKSSLLALIGILEHAENGKIHEELMFIGWKRTITHHPEGYLNQLVICSGAVELGFLQSSSVGLEMTCCLGWEFSLRDDIVQKGFEARLVQIEFSHKKLQLVQNFVAPLLTSTCQYEQMTLELQTLHWLPTSISLQFKMLVWKAIHGLAPENILPDLDIPGEPRGVET
ncbi:hypothetical protein L345_05411, partial [Ophiophagus hannah]